MATLPTPPDPDQLDDLDALIRAARTVLAPLARLAISQGVRHAALEEVLRQSFVQVAREAIHDAQPGVLPHRMVSRISTVTGLTRREVTRLTQADAVPAAPRRSIASEVFTRWVSDPRYWSSKGAKGVLPRHGPSPSFDALAQSITRDVHPRSVLDELCRLGLARVDEATDTVAITREAFVPAGDKARLLTLLGENTGDHLQAAVSNILAPGETPYFEQALWADGLSARSIEEMKALTRAQWQVLLKQMVPVLEHLIAEDQACGRQADQRLRIGLYGYSQTMAGQAADPDAGEDLP